jgi:hypothetical protein
LVAKTAKSGVVKSRDFEAPGRITPSQMEGLLEAYGIAGPNKRYAVAFLNELVSASAKDIQEAQKHHRKDARKELAVAADLVAAAGKKITNSNLLGREILQHSVPNQLNGMFSLRWLNKLSPGHALLPTMPTLRRETPIRARTAQSDEEVGFRFLRLEGPKVLGSALSQIASTLSDALNRSKRKGGRTRNLHRHLFIVNLAVLWEEKLKRDCRSTQGLSFKHFCEDVFGYIGWPTGGIKRAVDKAITDYYQRSNRN